MRITKVYTRTGDKGGTRLVMGRKVSKDDIRIESYGTVDELNSVVGIARVEIARSDAPQDPAAPSMRVSMTSRTISSTSAAISPPSSKTDGSRCVT